MAEYGTGMQIEAGKHIKMSSELIEPGVERQWRGHAAVRGKIVEENYVAGIEMHVCAALLLGDYWIHWLRDGDLRLGLLFLLRGGLVTLPHYVTGVFFLLL